MNSTSLNKIEDNRRLCILKDTKELRSWMHTLEHFNEELSYFNALEKQLIKNLTVANNLKAIRRKNILLMAALCKYEQELKTEFEYGKIEYNSNRSKYHEQKRDSYFKLIEEYDLFKKQIYKLLLRFRR